MPYAADTGWRSRGNITDRFRRFLQEKYGLPVIVGTPPIPQKYFLAHGRCDTWHGAEWQELQAPTLAGEATRPAYD
jgi:hypothetical protein